MQALPGRAHHHVLLDDGIDQDKSKHAARVDEAENQTQAEDDSQHDQTQVLGNNQADAEKKVGSMKVNRQGAEAPLKCRGRCAAAQEQAHHAQGDPAAADERTKKQAQRFVPRGGKRFDRRQRARFSSAGGDETEGVGEFARQRPIAHLSGKAYLRIERC